MVRQIMARNSNNHDRPKRKPRGGHLLPDGRREHRYSQELADDILRRISAGETLAEICADPAIPVSTGAVRQWIIDDRDGFSSAYAQARRSQMEAWSDQLLAIADDSRLEPNDRRVRLDTRKWLMARLHPARFGDRVQLAGDPAAPIAHVVGVVDLKKLSSAELDALEQFTNARLAAKNPDGAPD
jgi:hypothetical protein